MQKETNMLIAIHLYFALTASQARVLVNDNFHNYTSYLILRPNILISILQK